MHNLIFNCTKLYYLSNCTKLVFLKSFYFIQYNFLIKRLSDKKLLKLYYA